MGLGKKFFGFNKKNKRQIIKEPEKEIVKASPHDLLLTDDQQATNRNVVFKNKDERPQNKDSP